MHPNDWLYYESHKLNISEFALKWLNELLMLIEDCSEQECAKFGCNESKSWPHPAELGQVHERAIRKNILREVERECDRLLRQFDYALNVNDFLCERGDVESRIDSCVRKINQKKNNGMLDSQILSDEKSDDAN